MWYLKKHTKDLELKVMTEVTPEEKSCKLLYSLFLRS